MPREQLGIDIGHLNETTRFVLEVVAGRPVEQLRLANDVQRMKTKEPRIDRCRGRRYGKEGYAAAAESGMRAKSRVPCTLS